MKIFFKQAPLIGKLEVSTELLFLTHFPLKFLSFTGNEQSTEQY